MARKPPPVSEIQRLILLGEISRARLSEDAIHLKHRLDFPSRVRGSLKSHPGAWFVGALASGLGAAVLFRRRPAKACKSSPPQPKTRKTLPLTLLGLALTSIRPIANAWLANQLKSFAARRFIIPPRRTTQPPPTSPFQPY